MKDELEKIIYFLRMDSGHLFERIHDRFEEYMYIFASKRTREHFLDVFFSRYRQLTFHDLKLLSQDLMVAVDAFYTDVEKLRWYLNHTEDMPNTVRDHVKRSLIALKKKYDILDLHLGAELSLQSVSQEESDEPLPLDS